MKSIKEDFYFNGNYILEVTNEYVPTSVKGWYYESTSKKIPITVNEIGSKFISLDEDVELKDGTHIEIEYGIEYGIKRIQINERLQELEKRVEDQQKIIELILEALKHRVDIQTFSTYLKSLETQIGIQLFDQVFTTPYPAGPSLKF